MKSAVKTRRKFIGEAGGLATVICSGIGVSFILDSCSSIQYVEATLEKNQLIVSKSAFVENTFVVVRNKTLPAPIYLIKENNESYKALLMLCTHKECTLKPTGNFLSCPCHGSEFSNTGQVMKSPAEENLKTYSVSIDKENINIHL